MSESRSGHPLGNMWIYTALRIAVFAVLFGALLLLGVEGLLAALIAVVLSVPVSYVALARPRARLAESLSDRMGRRRADLDHLEDDLSGKNDPPPRTDSSIDP